MTHPPTGKLIGIGAGPGDPELITVKALRSLQAASVVAFPAGRKGQPGVAERAIAGWLKPQQRRLPLYFPYVQALSQLQPAWQQAAQTVLGYLEAGETVVFASEGDVSFYSTFTYLAQSLLQLQPAAQVEAVPGVCSPLAAAAVLGQPLTVQGQRLTVLPALYCASDLETVLTWADVVVLLKVSSVYRQVWQILHRCKLLRHSYIVERATTEHQIVYADLRAYPDLQLPYFSILIVQNQIRQFQVAALPCPQ
ncbi:MAG: precorrin-2 C(20)-methyltransferase [Leptolyngbya sp. SIO4C1]|nr:precorrin-2 C(20)-methyltransferase [Leptolyngbya sp. SIO4C1]